jgi:hypothetical protein
MLTICTRAKTQVLLLEDYSQGITLAQISQAPNTFQTCQKFSTYLSPSSHHLDFANTKTIPDRL